ncbi:type I-E CRISPR-associated protein Cas5/CasD [Thermoactinospora rubra]|uniref:type I-E CRISPR-associated protein Cas5/CasD n=1 Tax=Thermoactinospora rubra TaxID=1088767 RepID=UPI000A10B25D|nr:type I-E CRISPR-associated protein Cas5/CasD [Thermoactinospora rubra]
MSGLVLRLAGPLQSWGEHSAFTNRDTLRYPTRSGLIGLLASAQGVRRGRPLTPYDDLRFTVRIDRPGVPMVDFHTIGGGLERGVPTAEGGQRSRETATMVTRRQYLSDAVFTVAVEGPHTDELADALRNPRWHPYLGRRSCPPDQPLLLRADVADPVAELEQRVPIARRGTDLRVDFVVEGMAEDAAAVTELADVPETFGRFDRRYRTRSVSLITRQVPKELCATGADYWEALADYMGAAS